MTKDYSHAISWIENHNNPDNYEDGDYNDFISDAKEKFAHSELFNEPEFLYGIDDLWHRYHEDDITLSEDEIFREGERDTNIVLDTPSDNVVITKSATITENQAPVRIDSKSPIRITPLPRVEPTLPKGTIIIVPEQLQQTPQQRVSFINRISSGLRRLFGRR